MPTLANKLEASKKTYGPHLVIKALAGTGKTTSLIEGAGERLGTKSKLTPSDEQQALWDAMMLGDKPSSVAFCSFGKAIANELEKRVPPGCEGATMHRLGNRIVTKQFGRLNLEQDHVQNVISEVTGKDIWDLRKRDQPLLKGTSKLVDLCKQNLCDGTPEELDMLTSHYDVDLNNSKERIYALVPDVLEHCKEVDRYLEMDYNDMIWLPVVLDLPADRIGLLMVDEAQDLNRGQQALALKLGLRLGLCGDINQAIYGFAGADSESIPRMEAVLEDTELGCMSLPLTVTRRCGKAIVAEAQKLVPEFAAHESNSDGAVTNESFGTYANKAKDGDMAVCRINAPLVGNCFKFLKQGRKATIQGRDVGKGLVSTIKKLKASTISDLVRKLNDWHHQQCMVESNKRFPKESKIQMLGDKRDCIECFCQNNSTVDKVINSIQAIFTDNKDNPGIVLSSIHRAKGLEAKRVFFLQPPGVDFPAKSKWQQQ